MLAVTIAIGAFLAAGTTADREGHRVAAQRDALRLGHRLGAVHQLQPASLGLRDGRARAALRDAVPLRPAQGQVHPVARDERPLGGDDVRRSTSAPGVKWNDGKPFTAADVKYTFETGKLEGSESPRCGRPGLQRITTAGNTVRFVFKGTPELPGLGLPDVLGAHRPAPHLDGLQRDRDHDRQRGRGLEDGRHGAVQVRRPARARPRPSSGTAGTAGGRRRPSG